VAITLSAGARFENIEKSVNNFLATNLSGINLDWGQPNFKEEGYERWAQSSVVAGRRDFVRQTRGGEIGNSAELLIVVNLFERYPPRSNVYKLSQDREEVIESIMFADIPVYDYSTAGNPKVGIIQVREIVDDVEIDGGRLSGIRQWNLVFSGRYVESWS
jgi:hypothetical protein